LQSTLRQHLVSRAVDPSWLPRSPSNETNRRDRAILKALADKDRAFLQTLPRNNLHADSSEILNQVALAGAAEGIDLDWFEYVPGYRTPAGTRTGMSFATWG
jgi:hypothetical protein